MMPSPDGAGVASRGDVSTGLGDGFLDGSRNPVWSRGCWAGGDVTLGIGVMLARLPCLSVL
jgi:hypothetical protein